MPDLYTENRNLRRQLRAFLRQARTNEEKMRRFQAQELKLISANSLVDLVGVIFNEYRTSFELDDVTLMLHDPSFELQHILTDGGIDQDDLPGLIFIQDAEDLITSFGFTTTPSLGPFQHRQHRTLFADPVLASVALIPLIRHGELIGSLNLGSRTDERFIAGAATDFLERLAAIVAISLENAANHERLKRVGVTDFLTSVNNRRFFDQRLLEEMMRLQRTGGPLACLLIDIDNFKGINDTHGHRAGDVVLKDAAASIRQQLRATDVLARYGGEEFVALLIDTTESTASDIAERIRAAIANQVTHVAGIAELSVTISIGLASLAGFDGPVDADLLGQELLDCADGALYKAKKAGKNRVVAERLPGTRKPADNVPA